MEGAIKTFFLQTMGIILMSISISMAKPGRVGPPPQWGSSPSIDPTDLMMPQWPHPSQNCSQPCGVGICMHLPAFSPYANPSSTCVCTKPYIDQGDNKCSYKAKSKLITFLLSFLAGGLGVDWFYLSCGEAGYIVAGIVKLVTFGGFGIWWLIDWIRVLTDHFGDGMGMELFMDM